MRWKVIAGFTGLSVLIGSIWIPERVLTGEASTGYVVALANTIGAITAFVLCLLLRVQWPSRREWRSLLIACGGFMASIAVLYTAAMLPGHLSALEILTLHASSPLAVVLFTPLWLGGSVPRKVMLWMLAGLGGILLLLSVSLQISWDGAFDAVFGFIAVLCMAAAFLYASRELRGVAPAVSAAVMMSAMAVLAWPLAAYSGQVQVVDWSGSNLAAILLLSIPVMCGGLTLGFWLLQHMEPYKLVMARIAAPVVMMAEVWIVLGGWPGWERAVGGALAIASVVGVLRVRGDEDEPAKLFPARDAQAAELH
jgi:drug/metabolite transporter (DMT)-like permease